MRLISLFSLFAAILISSNLNAEILFQDDFEGGALNPAWTITKTNDGKVSIRNDHGPASGQGHLVFEDAVDDTTFSVAEATIALDVTKKKNVVLTFKAKSLGNDPHDPNMYWYGYRNYDAVSISGDGGLSWFPIYSLAAVGTDWEAVSINLDEMIIYSGLSDSRNLLIRISAYDNASVPVDGLAIDDVSISGEPDQRVVLEIPSQVTEGEGPMTIQAYLAIPSAEPVTVSLSQGTPGQFVIPSEIIFPAGQTSTTFQFSVSDDDKVNLTRYASIGVGGEGITADVLTILVKDDEPLPSVTLSVPSVLREGDYHPVYSEVSISAPLDIDVVFYLEFDPDGEMDANRYSMTIPAGSTTATFSLWASNDYDADGDIPVTVTVYNEWLGSTSAQTVAEDNEAPVLSLEFADTITEGSVIEATLKVSKAPAIPVTVNLSGMGANLPSWVVIPAGESSVGFQISVHDDALTNLTRSTSIYAEASGHQIGSKNLTILDNENPPVVTLKLPESVTEGGASSPAEISLSAPASVNVRFLLSASPTYELAIQSDVTIYAGQTKASFSVSALNDTRIDGDVEVTVSATSPVFPVVTGHTRAVDNESLNLRLSLLPSLPEGDTRTATVSLSGTMLTPVTVTLASSDPASLAVPPTVVIPAENLTATFPLTAVDNALKDGTRTASLTATAASFVSATGTVEIRDNDPVRYAFSSLPGLIPSNRPISIDIRAYDILNNQITSAAGRLDLELVAQDETSAPLAPSFVNMSGSGWSGTITLPSLGGNSFRLRVTDAAGVVAESSAFGMIRNVDLVTSDLVWDATRSLFYASVPASSPDNPNRVVAIDPVTLRVTASVITGNDPQRMELTSGGEYLYVVLRQSGSIAKIDPSTMTVVSTFPVGTSGSYTLYASDICTVAGQPDVLLVSQVRDSPNYPYTSDMGVAAYENGVMRPVKAAGVAIKSQIEPSADPSVFFGYNIDTSGYVFRVLKLDATGVVIQQSLSNSLFGSSNWSSTQIVSGGNQIYSNYGVVADGSTLSSVSNLPVYDNSPRPDPATGRVYYLDREKISSFRLGTFELAKELSMYPFDSATDLTRWGGSGLAFRSADGVFLVDGDKLVPSGPPVDLVVGIAATPEFNSPVSTNFTLKVTNQSENPAADVVIKSKVASGYSIQLAESSEGSPIVSGRDITMTLDELGGGESAVITIDVYPYSGGNLSCHANVTTTSLEGDLTNNSAVKLVTAAFPSSQDAVTRLGLNVNNLIYDASRKLLWVTTVPSTDHPLKPSLISIDPATGTLSTPVPFDGQPMTNSVALSRNGRYLYFGLSDISEVHRYDLSVSPPSRLRIPLGLSVSGAANYANDIEVLDGDGTSFIIAGKTDKAAAVYDGTVMRAIRTGSSMVDRIERGATAGAYVCEYTNYGTTIQMLNVNAAGVTITQSASSPNYGFEIKSDGNLMFSTSGYLWNTETLNRSFVTTSAGTPCVDATNRRVFGFSSIALYAFDADTRAQVGNLSVNRQTGSYPPSCVRWGQDGLAFTDGAGNLSVLRWSHVIPALVDRNADGVGDGWAMKHFATSDIAPESDADGDGIPNALEYFFNTDPLKKSANPVAFTAASPQVSGLMGATLSRIRGLSSARYVYETSDNLVDWTEVVPQESIISTSTTTAGVVDNVKVTMPTPGSGRGFIRVKWKKP